MSFPNYLIKVWLSIACLLLINGFSWGQTQLVIRPSTACGACDAAVSVKTTWPGVLTYKWYAEDGTQLSKINSNAGVTALFSLCPGQYYLDIISSSDSLRRYFNVAIPGFNPGSNTTYYSCLDKSAFNLSTAFAQTPTAGGVWVNPSGTSFSGVFDPAVDSSGIYTYTLNTGLGCSLTSKVEVLVQKNARVGSATSPLICDNYSPFALFDFFSGSSDPGGRWFRSLNDYTLNKPFDGWFYPDTMQSGVYYYVIDSIPGCDPVFSNMPVQVNKEPKPGLDTKTAICRNLPLVDLTSLLNGSPDLGGKWYNPSNQVVGSSFNAASDAEGVYRYVVTGMVPCTPQQAKLEIVLLDSLEAGGNHLVDLCNLDPPLNLNTLLKHKSDVPGNWTGPVAFTGLFNPATMPAGDYQYKVEALGCLADTANILVSVDQFISAGADGLSAFCTGSGILTLFDLLDPLTDKSGQWWLNANPVAADYLLPDSTQNLLFEYRIDQAICPDAYATWDIALEEKPEAGASFKIDYCVQDPLVDLYSLLPPDIDNSGVWTDAAGLLPATTFNPSLGQGVNLYYKLDYQNSCPPDSTLFELTVDPGFAFPVLPDTAICLQSGSLSFSLPDATGYNYQWGPKEWLSDISGPRSDMLLQSQNEAGQITVSVEMDNGVCYYRQSFGVELFAAPVADAGEDIDVCLSALFRLEGQGADKLSWSPAAEFTDPTLAIQDKTAEQSAFYYLEAENEWGCRSTDSVEVRVHAYPSANFRVSGFQFCSGEALVINNLSSGRGPLVYNWKIGPFAYKGYELEPLFLPPGEYPISIEVVNDFGCADAMFLADTIVVRASPDAAFYMYPAEMSVIDPLLSLSDESAGADQIKWEIEVMGDYEDSELLLLFPGVADQYYEICLTAENRGGCADRFCDSVFVKGAYLSYVPNAFTPNADGVNDDFFPVVEGFSGDHYLFQVYDRWGILIFESTEPGEAWIGDFRRSGHILPADVYVWKLELGDLYSTHSEIIEGHVSLMR